MVSCQTATDKKQNPDSAPATPAAIPAVVSGVQNAQEGGQFVLSGSAEAETTVNLGFMVGEKLNRVTIQEGQTIRAGQLIASIEPTDYQLGVTIANVNVARIWETACLSAKLPPCDPSGKPAGLCTETAFVHWRYRAKPTKLPYPLKY